MRLSRCEHFKALYLEKDLLDSRCLELTEKVKEQVRKLIAEKNAPTSIPEFIKNEINAKLLESGLKKNPNLDKYLSLLNHRYISTVPQILQKDFEDIDIPFFSEWNFFEKAAALPWREEAHLLRQTLEHLIIQKCFLSFSEVEVKLDADLHRMPPNGESISFINGGVDYPHFNPGYQALFQVPILKEGEEEAYFHLIEISTSLAKRLSDLSQTSSPYPDASTWKDFYDVYQSVIKLKKLKKTLKNSSVELQNYLRDSLLVFNHCITASRYDFFYRKKYTGWHFVLNFTHLSDQESLAGDLLAKAVPYLRALSSSYTLDYFTKSAKAPVTYQLSNHYDLLLYRFLYLKSIEDKEKIQNIYCQDKEKIASFYQSVYQRLDQLKKEKKDTLFFSTMYQQPDTFVLGGKDFSMTAFRLIAEISPKSIFEFHPSLHQYIPPVSLKQFETSFHTQVNSYREILSNKDLLNSSQSQSLSKKDEKYEKQNERDDKKEEKASEEKIKISPQQQDSDIFKPSLDSLSLEERENGKWQEVGFRSLKTFQKPFKYKHAQRVLRWFSQDPSQPLSPEFFPEYQNKGLHYQKKMLHYHAFAPQVDEYLSMGTVLSGSQELAKSLMSEADKKTRVDRVKFIGLPAKLTLESETPQYGLLLYKIKNGVCYHRYFHPINSNKDLFNVFVSEEKKERLLKEGLEKDTSVQPPLPPVKILSSSQRYSTLQDERVLEIEDLAGKSLLRVYSTKL